MWDYNRKKLFPIRAKERAVDLIDLDDQMAATEVRRLRRALCRYAQTVTWYCLRLIKSAPSAAVMRCQWKCKLQLVPLTESPLFPGRSVACGASTLRVSEPLRS